MRRRILSIALAAVLGAALAAVEALTQQQQAPQLKIQNVKGNLYEIEGRGGNVAVLVTNEGVILVDDLFEQNHDGILEKVKSVTEQPVKYVINTHHHSDHSGGNVRFIFTAEIISTANARKNILEKKQPDAPANMTPARVVFTDQTSLFLGGQEVRAKYHGRGHTNGDAVIYFPALRTVHMGDLMASTQTGAISPIVDYNGGGSLVDWTKTLDEVLQLDFDTVIPGHGAVTNKPSLQTYRANLEKLRNRITGLIREKKSQDEIGKVLTAEYGWGANSLNLQWGLPGMMTELK